MSESDEPSPVIDTPVRVPSHVTWICYGLLGLVLLVVVIARQAGPAAGDDASAFQTDRFDQVAWRIDPNTAGWAELARLPGIGETLARRIVAYREQQRAELGPEAESEVVFRSLQDLEAVRGIGPKRLARIADLIELPASR